MDNIIDIELTGRSTRREQKLWQYDYGQVLRIAGKEFPKVTEVQFSLKQSGGHTLDRIGTSNNGLLTVQIPNELLQNKGTTSDYTIYAFVYLTGDGFGNTKYMIQLPVESRPEPTDPSEDPSIDPSIFKDAVNAVNASAERAETAEKSAKESADKAKEYAESARKSKEDVEKARDNAISAIGIEKESALRGIESKTVESLQKIQSQTEESQNSIKQSIDDATKKKTELDGAIGNATDAKGNLDKAVQSAGNAKAELDTSVGKAGEAKTALDSAIKSAGEKKLALDATVEQANTVDASLKEQIGSAEQIQANVEQIGKNTQAISSLNEDIADLQDKKITKFYASNQGEKHLVDSDNGKIQDMVIYGMSEQESTTGANLIDVDSMLNECLVKNYDGTYSILKTETNRFSKRFPVNLKAGAKVRFDADVIEYNGTYNIKLQIVMGDYTLSAGQTIVLGSDITEVKIYQDNKNDVGTYTKFKNAMLSIGEAQIPYEPYTGGKPSPSPEYPQEIVSVGGNGSIEVNVIGKNLTDIYGYSANDIPNPEAERVLFNIYGTTLSTTEKTDKLIVHQEIIDGATTNSYASGYFCIGINRKLEANKDYIITFRINVIRNPLSASNVKVSFNGIEFENGKIIGDKVTVKAKYTEYRERQYVEFRTRGMSLEISNFMITEVGETDDYEPYTEQSVQLPYTLNAIPVASGGNVTIDGQQYVADYVNVERGKLVKMVDSSKLDNTQSIVNKTEWLLAEPQEIDLTQEEVQTLKTLATYYPTTNIFINSDQLDGYTVFNYPISMANGWNYVKQQLNDNRDYIYDMDIQSAEAYVNSEYAVALTELEV